VERVPASAFRAGSGLLDRHWPVVCKGAVARLPPGMAWQVPGLVFSNGAGVTGCLALPQASALSFLEVHLALVDERGLIASEAQLRAALLSAQDASAAAPEPSSLALMLPSDRLIIESLSRELADVRAENLELKRQLASQHTTSAASAAALALPSVVVPVPDFVSGSDFAVVVRTKPLTCGMVDDAWLVAGSTAKALLIAAAGSALDLASSFRHLDLPSVPLCVCRAGADRIAVGTMDGAVLVIDAQLGTTLASWHHAKHVYGVCLGVCLGEDVLASVSRDGTVLLSEAATGAARRKLVCTGTPECCAWTGRGVAVAVRDTARLSLVAAAGGTADDSSVSLNAVAGDDHCSFAVLAMAALENAVLCVTDKNLVLLVDAESGKRTDFAGLVSGDFSRPCVAWHPNGRFFAASSEPNRVCVWHVASGAHVLLEAGHKGAVRALAFHGDKLWSWGMDGVVATCSYVSA